MTPYKQLYPHNPEAGIFGDCYRTAIGCLLDLPPEKVPHFYDGLDKKADATEANKSVRYWLKQQGYALVTFAYDGIELDHLLNVQQINNPDTYYMLSGQSGGHDCNHVVIARGGQIVWDPSKKNSGVIGPGTDNQIVIEYIVPASMLRNEETDWLIDMRNNHESIVAERLQNRHRDQDQRQES